MIFDSENCVEEFEAWYWEREDKPRFCFARVDQDWMDLDIHSGSAGGNRVLYFAKDHSFFLNSQITSISVPFPPSDNEASTVRMPRELTGEDCLSIIKKFGGDHGALVKAHLCLVEHFDTSQG